MQAVRNIFLRTRPDTKKEDLAENHNFFVSVELYFFSAGQYVMQ